MITSEHANNELIEACLSEIGLGVAIFDHDQRLQWHNDRFQRLMRLPPEMLHSGTRYIDIIRFNRDRGVINELNRDHQAEARLPPHDDGSRSPYRTSLLLPWGDVITMRLTPLNGGPFMVTYRRVSRRRRAEQETAKALQQAHAATQAAEFASRAKTQFLANMSHELRTPLNAIIGFADFMAHELRGPLGVPEYKKYAADIVDAGTHLLRLVDDLLDISKIESGKAELREESTDIFDVIRSCAVLLAGRAQQGGVELEIKDAPVPVCLLGDPRMLKQIVVNLASNAIKFTPRGGRVTIMAERGPGGGISVIVADTGVGIAAEDIATALAPFGQIQNALIRRQEGTGLGLPLAKSMAELHGGTLTIESQTGVGTTVTVRLPAERVLARTA